MIGVLNAIANGACACSRVEPKDEVSSGFTAEEVQSIVAESARPRACSSTSRAADRCDGVQRPDAADVMVPLDGLVAVRAGSTPDEVERLVPAPASAGSR